MTGTLRQGPRRLLVVEDDADTANLLKIYFSGHNYEVQIASNGADALVEAQRRVPDLVLLDIVLPDPKLDGFAVLKALRSSPRTNYVPIVFLTGKKLQADQVAGLSLGAQDYVVKPFDLEELRLRLKNILVRTEREHLMDPRTNLPTGRLADEQMRNVSGRPGWQVLTCRILSFQPFVDLNGFAAGDDVLKFAAQLLHEVTAQTGTPQDLMVHPANDTFVILCAGDAPALAARLQERFNAEVLVHYGFMDREQGFIQIRGADGQMIQAPLMTLAVAARPA
jgi:PleD family two-component response regulator